MIYDNSIGDTFYQYYTDDPLGFLIKAKIDTKEARKEVVKLRKTLAEIENVIDRVEQAENKNDLWSRYTRGELPHIHCSKDPLQNAFLDALSIQADRIRENIKKKYTLSDEELRNLMFGE